jgi:hypothetical protein
MAAIEEEIMDKIRHLDETAKRRVLEFVNSIELPPQSPYRASALMKLPFEERERLVRAAIAASADQDFEIFEAYTEEDLDDLA